MEAEMGKWEEAMIRIVCFGIGYLFGLFQTSYIIGLLMDLIFAISEAGTLERQT